MSPASYRAAPPRVGEQRIVCPSRAGRGTPRRWHEWRRFMGLKQARGLSPAQQVSLLSGGDFWRTRAVPEAGIDAAVLSDGPHGLRFQPNPGDDVGTAGS